MKQSGLRFFMFAVGFLSLLSSYAESYWVDGFAYEFEGNEASVIGCSLSGDIAIPDRVTNDGITYIVTSVGRLAFYCNHSVTSIRIPNTVSIIQNNAFIYADALKYVYIPNSVTTIVSGAFYDNPNLTAIVCMASIPPAMEIQFFEGLEEGKVSLYVPASSLEAYQLAPNWEHFKSIFPIDTGDFCVDGIYYMDLGGGKAAVTCGVSGFGNYNGSVVIPETVTYNGISYEVTGISDFAFAFCNALKSLSIPVTITSIGNNAFAGCFIQSLIITGNGAWMAGSLKLNVNGLFIGEGITAIKGMRVEASVVYSFASNPPICDEYTFISYDGELHVPPASFSAYFTAPYWNYFLNITGDAVFVWPVSVNLSQSNALLEIGEDVELTAAITPLDCSYKTISWASSNSNVAIVNEGVITALASGECDIIASCLTATATCHIVVVEKKIYISLDKKQASVLPNHMITITPSLTPVSTDITVISSNPDVAFARLAGGIIQVAGITEGTTTIMVNSVDGFAFPDSCIVTVYTDPGDVNCDGYVNIGDVTSLINYLLSDSSEGLSTNNSDTNHDGKVNIGDVTTLINFLLSDTWPWDEPVLPLDDHEWVDLGLPSGTLWATCNIGASCPEDYGDYFAWGETAPKDEYDWETYKWCNGSKNTMTKYCANSNYGKVDGKTELDLEDDAAYVNWGPSWRMPSQEQIEELCTECTWTWTTRNGVYGRLVTGPNGNAIFLPAAGSRSNESLNDADSKGYYWLRTLEPIISSNAIALVIYGANWQGVFTYDYFRHFGYTIRAVRVSQN